MIALLPWLLSIGFAWVAACGPSELPAFANPPPDDAGAHPDAGDQDAGSDRSK